MIQTYYDLKPGEKLAIEQRGIALEVRRLATDGSAFADIQSRYHRGRRFLRRGQYVRLDERTGIYNFGNRHHGRRMHIRLEIYQNRPASIEKIACN